MERGLRAWGKRKMAFHLCAKPERRYLARMDANAPQREGNQMGAKRFETAAETERAARRPERFCPNCSTELQESRCKLSCPVCGFCLSCSDFY